jgi:Arc/MetJ-type ribon-helix-helix transcriptional regulator
MERPKPKASQDKRPRGRPFAGGRDPAVGVRLPWRVITALDKWGKERGFGSRSEAIRHLVQIGLAHSADAEAKETR